MADDSKTGGGNPQAQWLEQIFQSAYGSLAQIKLSGGVVGRIATTSMICATVIGLVLIASAIAGQVVLGSIGAVILALIGWYSISTIREHARENPLTSMMEGAELLLHQQIMQGMKNTPVLAEQEMEAQNDPSLPTPIEGEVIDSQPDDIKALPDAPPIAKMEGE